MFNGYISGGEVFRQNLGLSEHIYKCFDTDSIFKPCSERGVDSRSDDLIGQLILVQIGWDIPGFGFKPQVTIPSHLSLLFY